MEFDTALLADGPGASAGGEEIAEGEIVGVGEVAEEGVGDGGELTTVGGDGATAGGVLEEDGAGACDRVGVSAPEALGDAAGDCATAENAHIATNIRTGMQKRAILSKK